MGQLERIQAEVPRVKRARGCMRKRRGDWVGFVWLFVVVGVRVLLGIEPKICMLGKGLYSLKWRSNQSVKEGRRHST